jgi:predicted DNA-binding transcriptional regulator YafY
MARPTARVLVLLEILEGGGTHTATHLAERLGVDERTVRRYADHLLDLDVPIESVRGRYGGYRLAPGFRMPPLMLTDEEALAVLLGLVAGRRAGLVTTSQEAADTAAAKVRRVLPTTLASRLDALFAAVDFTGPGRDATTASTPVMLTLADATRQHRPAAISYTDRAGHRTERTVHPYGLVAHSGRWYVTATDAASGELRTFRLDRIVQARIGEGTFATPEDFDPTATVLSSLATTPWRHEVVVAVQGTPARIHTRLPRGVATAEPHPDHGPGWLRVRLRAEHLDWLPAALAGLEIPFVVEQPAELRDLLSTWTARLARAAAATTPTEAAAAWHQP